MDIQGYRRDLNCKSIIRRPGSNDRGTFVSRNLVSMVKTPDAEWWKIELLAVQRWENEGGQIIETNELMYGQPRARRVEIYARKYARALRWSAGWVIEPFQKGKGILGEDRTSKGIFDD